MCTSPSKSLDNPLNPVQFDCESTDVLQLNFKAGATVHFHMLGPEDCITLCCTPSLLSGVVEN